jgi:hypothetical protein
MADVIVDVEEVTIAFDLIPGRASGPLLLQT